MGQHDVPTWKVWIGLGAFMVFLMIFIQLVGETPKNIGYGLAAGAALITTGILTKKANKND